MSAYNSYLMKPSQVFSLTSNPSKSTTPKKYTFHTPAQPLDSSKHIHDIPVANQFSAHRYQDFAGKHQSHGNVQAWPEDNSKLYSSNHVPAPKYNPQNGPSIRILPQAQHFPPSQPKTRGLKSRKGSENAMGLQNKLSVNFEARQGSNFFISQKQRRGSCSNLLLNGGYKRPRMSMFEPGDAQTKLAPISEKVIVKKKLWAENQNFKMQQNNLELETNSSEALRIPKQQKNCSQEPHPKNQQGSKERKHSDNEGVKKSPSFLSTPRAISRRYSMIPQRKWSIQRFKIIKQLGKGAYGRVVLAMEKESRFICAIKILSKRDLQEENMVEQFTREIKIQCYFKHPNIIKVYGCFDDLLHLYVVMECALDQRLSDLLEERKPSEAQAASMFYQICSAVNQLHVESVIHRDLKPENVMLHEGVIKLCDFGWSVYRGSQLRTTFCGTPLYLSPEILVGDSYDESVDVWALGIMLYEIVIGGNPFEIKEAKDLVNIIHENVDLHSKELSHGLKEILQACLRKKGEDRPSVKWVMGREWVSKGRPEQSARFTVKAQRNDI